MESDDHAVRAVHAAWIAAVNAGDLARLRTLAAPDAIFVGPGQAPYGFDGLAANFAGAVAANRIACASAPQDVAILGDVACVVSRDAVSVQPRDGGAAMALAGDRLSVYRRQADGRWLLARDAHTVAPTAS